MLARRFDWQDFETVYKRVIEDQCEPLGSGRYTFIAIDAEGKRYKGSAFEITVASMCDSEFWKLSKIRSIKTGKEISIVVEVISN